MTKVNPFYILVTFFIKPMKIRVDQIPDEGLRLDYEEPADSFAYLRKEEKGTGAAVGGPVHVSLAATKTSGGVAVKGRLQGNVSVTCSRCLADMAVDVSHDFFYECLPAEAMEEEEELSKDSVDIHYYTGGEIDITALVQEQLALALPMRPLCREDCKGLCPKCGANLNLGDCGCQRGPADLRFAALKNIKIK